MTDVRSDLSGEQIVEADPERRARLIVEFGDAGRGVYILEVTLEEAEDLARRGRHVEVRTSATRDG